MVQRRHLACEQIRQLVERCDSDAEAKMLRRRRHRGDGGQRIVGRRLQSLTQGLVGAAAIDVENAEGVGDEKAVELPALERLGELDPKGQLLVTVRLARPSPPSYGRRHQGLITQKPVVFLGQPCCLPRLTVYRINIGSIGV